MTPRALNNKVVLITGSTKSIGAAIAKAFSAAGATVIASGRKSAQEEKTQALAAGAADYVSLNVSEEKNWQDVTAYIQKIYGKLDILINNAGVCELPEAKSQDPEHTSLDDWRTIFSINVEGMFLGCKYSIPLMKTSDDPCIINIGSRSALVGVPPCAAYAASKAAVSNYTKTVAIYGAQLFHKKQSLHPIRCVELQPANIETPMWNFGGDQSALANYASSLPFGRMGKPDNVAKYAVFVASNPDISGSSHLIDGGVMAGLCSYSSSEAPATSAPKVEVIKTTPTVQTSQRFFKAFVIGAALTVASVSAIVFELNRRYSP